MTQFNDARKFICGFAFPFLKQDGLEATLDRIEE